MYRQKQLIVSHAPFLHDGGRVPERNYNILVAALPAVIMGCILFGVPALGVIALSVSSAMVWELGICKLRKSEPKIADGNAAVIGLILAMLLPAQVPWWFVITGTFLAIVLGQGIYGGIGGNPFNPAVVSALILAISWGNYFDFNEAYINYELAFAPIYPLTALKSFGPDAVANFTPADLLMGKQIGGIGAVFGIGLIIGGLFLIIRGIVRLEISLTFLAGVFITAMVFNMVDPEKYANPMFHLLTGYNPDRRVFPGARGFVLSGELRPHVDLRGRWRVHDCSDQKHRRLHRRRLVRHSAH